jgi:hypothetical protein
MISLSYISQVLNTCNYAHFIHYKSFNRTFVVVCAFHLGLYHVYIYDYFGLVREF